MSTIAIDSWFWRNKVYVCIPDLICDNILYHTRSNDSFSDVHPSFPCRRRTTTWLFLMQWFPHTNVVCILAVLAMLSPYQWYPPVNWHNYEKSTMNVYVFFFLRKTQILNIHVSLPYGNMHGTVVPFSWHAPSMSGHMGTTKTMNLQMNQEWNKKCSETMELWSGMILNMSIIFPLISNTFQKTWFCTGWNRLYWLDHINRCDYSVAIEWVWLRLRDGSN